jgi:hypothetical protein
MEWDRKDLFHSADTQAAFDSAWCPWVTAAWPAGAGPDGFVRKLIPTPKPPPLEAPTEAPVADVSAFDSRVMTDDPPPDGDA